MKSRKALSLLAMVPLAALGAWQWALQSESLDADPNTLAVHTRLRRPKAGPEAVADGFKGALQALEADTDTHPVVKGLTATSRVRPDGDDLQVEFALSRPDAALLLAGREDAVVFFCGDGVPRVSIRAQPRVGRGFRGRHAGGTAS